ncbi:hypothetical protein FUA48_14265 [Flavobacterium alkalisoli]|uniref:Lipocalin-like domain-containing protein n=1 Tax=Flavobacterium alkalisoli TaxID=2602769 RepID=A0A5B9FWQ0_9FLAO|nr:hypothetical protein [Flavobacterium alkalisoli]QEE50699.1 hypothetical protein FUA48_14265 [Flavobacterium alkalisoli]
MRKLIALAFTAIIVCFTACSGNDDSPNSAQNTDTSQLLGKWVIYKGIYGEGTQPILYESNGECGRQILEFNGNGEVTETLYSDNDCNIGVAGTYFWWILDDGNIAFGAPNSYHHIITISNGELILDASEEADYIKYYHRPNN